MVTAHLLTKILQIGSSARHTSSCHFYSIEVALFNG